MSAPLRPVATEGDVQQHCLEQAERLWHLVHLHEGVEVVEVRGLQMRWAKLSGQDVKQFGAAPDERRDILLAAAGGDVGRDGSVDEPQQQAFLRAVDRDRLKEPCVHGRPPHVGEGAAESHERVVDPGDREPRERLAHRLPGLLAAVGEHRVKTPGGQRDVERR